jgi:hypothetical protein
MKWCSLAVLLAASQLAAADTGAELRARSMGPLLQREGQDAAVFRGGLVFANYCITCQGINA